MGQKKHRHHVQLTKEERSKLERMTTVGKIGVRKLKRCQILLLADESHKEGQKTDKEIAGKLDISLATVSRIRVRYAEGGLKTALNEKPRRGRPRGVSGEERAKVTALACSTPPDGFDRWSLRLLADKAVELELVEQISHTMVGNILKKTLSNPI